jgi:hypothetical protein
MHSGARHEMIGDSKFLSWFCDKAQSHLRMAILSMERVIHGYPIRWARVWRADHAHGFHGVDIQLLIGWTRVQGSWISDGYLADRSDPHVSETYTFT